MKSSSFIFIAILILLNYSCKEHSSRSKRKQVAIVIEKKDDYFNFSYGDRTVSPDYHRSYEISMEIDSITVIINSYSDTLLIKRIGAKKNIILKLFLKQILSLFFFF